MLVYWGNIGIMEKKMETIGDYRGYIRGSSCNLLERQATNITAPVPGARQRGGRGARTFGGGRRIGHAVRAFRRFLGFRVASSGLRVESLGLRVPNGSKP